VSSPRRQSPGSWGMPRVVNTGRSHAWDMVSVPALEMPVLVLAAQPLPVSPLVQSCGRHRVDLR
jgi:hypothetical protein